MPTAVSGGVVLATRLGAPSDVVEPPAGVPSVSVVVIDNSIDEGDTITLRLTRSLLYSGESTLDWVAVSSGGSADLHVPVSGTVVFPPNSVANRFINVVTIERSGTQGSRSVTITLSNPIGCTLPVTTFVITLNDFVEPPPSDDIPTPLSRVQVANSADFINKIDAASVAAGTQFELASGTYNATYTLSKVGTAAHPIVITRAPGASPVITGQIVLAGQYNIIHRLNMTGTGESKIIIKAANARITRNTIHDTDTDGTIRFQSNGKYPNCRIDHNLFKDFVYAMIRYDMKDVDANRHIRIDRNHFWGHSRSRIDSQNESVCGFLTDMFGQSYLSYEYNLFEDCMKLLPGTGTPTQREMIMIKTGYVTLIGNSVINCDGSFSLRESNNSVVRENYFDNSSWIIVHGENHLIEDNHAEGTLAFNCSGEAFPDSPTVASGCETFSKVGLTVVIKRSNVCKSAQCCAQNVTIRNNAGRIGIGDKDQGSFPCNHITLIDNDEHPYFGPGPYNNISETGFGNYVRRAFRLARTDVGPDSI